MTQLTTAQAVKEIRKAAKEVGLTFKMGKEKLNGDFLYVFTVRGTDKLVMGGCKIWNAYADIQNGYISSWNGKKFDVIYGNYPCSKVN